MAMAAAKPPSSRPLCRMRPWAPEVLTVVALLVAAAAVVVEGRTTTVEGAPVAVARTDEVLFAYDVGQATVLELLTGQCVDDTEVVVLWRLAGQLVTDAAQRVMVMVSVMERVEVVVPVVTAEVAATRVTTKARTVR